MTERFFDVAVIAEGLNGLLAAYELSRTDVSIVLIDNYRPSLEIDGYLFNYYPQHIFSYYELPDLLRQLHGVFETYTSPAFQLVLPDRRVDMYSEWKKGIAETNKRFQGRASALAEYLSREQAILELLLKFKETEDEHSGMMKRTFQRLRTGKHLLREKQRAYESLKRLLKEDIPSMVFHAALRQLFPWMNGDTALSDMRSVPALLRKRFYLVGGKDSLKNTILHELMRRNVNIVQEKEIDHIEYRKYFTIALDHEQSVRSRTIVAEPIYERTLSLLPSDSYRNIKKKYYVDNIFAGVHRSCLPEVYNRVNSAIIISDYKQPLSNDNLIFMDTNPISDIKRAKDEMAALTLCTLIQENSISKISAIRSATIEHVKKFMPFFDDLVENIYFTDPSILWDNKGVPVYKKGVLLLNDEFINQYTLDSKYAYIKKQIKKLISNL